MAEKTTVMKIEADLQCPCCYKKVKKILCKFPQEIRDQVYNEKANTVTITVVCCSPEKIRDKICCKGCKGGKVIKRIEIVEPPKPVPKPKPKPNPEPDPKPAPEPPSKEPKTPLVIYCCLPAYPTGYCCEQCYQGCPGGPCYHGCGRPVTPPPPPRSYCTCGCGGYGYCRRCTCGCGGHEH